MPEFINPFSAKVPVRKLTDGKLIRIIRLIKVFKYQAVYSDAYVEI
jgi:hypothetical protein